MILDSTEITFITMILVCGGIPIIFLIRAMGARERWARKPGKTYVLSTSGSHLCYLPTIKCLKCGMTSYHYDDVNNLYCGNCHEFHKR